LFLSVLQLLNISLLRIYEQTSVSRTASWHGSQHLLFVNRLTAAPRSGIDGSVQKQSPAGERDY